MHLRDMEPPVRALADAQMDAWNRGDGHAWAKDFSDDATFVNIMGFQLDGRAEIAERHARHFRTIFLGSRVVVVLRSVVSVGDDAVLARLDYALSGHRALPPGIQATDADGTLHTRMLYVLSRAGRQDPWQIVAGQNTALLSAAAAPRTSPTPTPGPR
jgi:uncharacterized protein (TIGR02246 family)